MVVLDDDTIMVIRTNTHLGLCKEITCDMFGLTDEEFSSIVRGITVRPGR